MKSSPVDIKLKLEPTIDQMKRDLKKKQDAVANFAPAMGQAATYLDQWVQQNFKTEGGKVGGWLPFKAGGRRRGGQLDTSAKLLQDTGRLRLSFLPFASKKNAGIGSRLDYSERHHMGIGVPERRLLPLVGEVRGPLREMFGIHVKRSLRK